MALASDKGKREGKRLEDPRRQTELISNKSWILREDKIPNMGSNHALPEGRSLVRMQNGQLPSRRLQMIGGKVGIKKEREREGVLLIKEERAKYLLHAVALQIHCPHQCLTLTSSFY